MSLPLGQRGPGGKARLRDWVRGAIVLLALAAGIAVIMWGVAFALGSWGLTQSGR